MSTNGFRDDELIKKQVNGQVKVFPVVGGRLRLAHEENDNLSLQTELISWDGRYAVFKCSAVTKKGQFIGYGTANTPRDANLLLAWNQTLCSNPDPTLHEPLF